MPLFQFLTRYPKTPEVIKDAAKKNEGFNSLLGILKPVQEVEEKLKKICFNSLLGILKPECLLGFFHHCSGFNSLLGILKPTKDMFSIDEKLICFNSLLGILKPWLAQNGRDASMRFQFLTRYPKTFPYEGDNGEPKGFNSLLGILKPSLLKPLKNAIKSFNSLLGILKPTRLQCSQTPR